MHLPNLRFRHRSGRLRFLGPLVLCLESVFASNPFTPISSYFFQLPMDPLTLSGRDIQDGLTSGRWSSVGVVTHYLDHIENHNKKYNILIEVAPKELVLDIAKGLDEERAQGKIRGPFHGVPIVVKDNIVTHASLGLNSTGGSYAFMDLKPKRTAAVLQRLIDAGAIILGKANLSEFANFKGAGMICGWSARGGQTQTPYVKGGWDPSEKFGGHSNPGGSSSGSACAVAAGFAPISVGTETWGSLIMPATRLNVFTLKPNRARISGDGVMPVSDILDISGPMARTATDIAHALDNMFDADQKEHVPQEGYTSKVTGSFDGLKLGAVDTKNWRIDTILADPDEDWFNQQETDLNNAYQKLKDLGVDIKFPIPFAERGILADVLSDVINHNFVKGFDAFLAGMESSSVKTVEELVAFNEAHADLEMPAACPNQDVLIGALKQETWDKQKLLTRLAEGEEHAGKNGIDKALEESGVDIILGPADCWLTDFACVAGYPSAVLPLSFWKKNGRAFGVIALVAKHREDLLVQLMSAWETVFPWSSPPKL